MLDLMIREKRKQFRRAQSTPEAFEILIELDALQRQRYKSFGSFLPCTDGFVYTWDMEEERFFRLPKRDVA